MSDPLRVVVADDHVLIRAGLVQILERSGLAVAAVAEDADDLLAKSERHQPDVVVTDIRMPPNMRDDGLRAALVLRGRCPHVGIVVLSQYLEDAYAIDLVAERPHGVGYLLKEKIADVNVISDAVRRVAAGESVFDSDVIARLIGRRHAAGGPLDGLTSREYEVLSLMAQGFSNFGIAARLVVTVPAVERHVTGIFAKLKLDQSYRAQHRRVSAVLAFLNASE